VILLIDVLAAVGALVETLAMLKTYTTGAYGFYEDGFDVAAPLAAGATSGTGAAIRGIWRWRRRDAR
jgi:hypothetical protein